MTLTDSQSDPAASRLEFRTFGDDLTELAEELPKGFASFVEEERTDVYFLGGDTAHVFKLRGQRILDLKVLIGQEDDYERWHPRGQCDLPAPGKVLRSEFPDSPDLPDFDEGEEYDPDKVASAFERRGFLTVSVLKRRTLFDAGSGTVEFASIHVEGRSITQTIALESEDRALLDQLRHRLHLSERSNCSYPRMLTGA
ncbi:hypothetical protein [Pseudooceanicola sp.]|uniref:hypothetical protein n=1 Tax=Pseudooceanicola sp. TaxID=1914328 RepID=UPI0035C76733